jgi:hypothetical protein
VQVGQVPAHFERNDRNRQNEADPEPPRHVDEFRARTALGRSHERLQRHAADGAITGAGLPDLWMHRAGVDRPLGNGGGRRLLGFRTNIFGGIGCKFFPAFGGTEIIRATPIGMAMEARVRIDCHAADRIDCAGCR